MQFHPAEGRPAFTSAWLAGALGLASLCGCQTPRQPQPPKAGTTPAATLGARITDFGTLVNRTVRARYPSGENPSKSTEVNTLVVKVAEHTDLIAAILDNQFGFTFEITNLPPREAVRLKRAVQPPPVRLGGSARGLEWIDELPLLVPTRGTIKGHVGVVFRDEAEMVPGKWTLELRAGDTVLLSKQFTVFSYRRLRTGPWGSYDLEAAWGPPDDSGLQMGVALPEPAALAVDIRNQGAASVHYDDVEIMVSPGLKLYARGPAQSWTLLNRRKPMIKFRQSRWVARRHGVVEPGDKISMAMIALKPGRTWNCSFAVSLDDFDWPVFEGSEVEIKMELDMEAPQECSDCWRGTLKSGVLVLPASALPLRGKR
jgi:hypothetical protein